MTYKEQLLDPRWKDKRRNILKDDNFTCQYCGAKNKILDVHHIEYKGKAWDANEDKLITLCRACHFIHHQSHNLTELENELISMIRISVLFTECKDFAATSISQKANEIILKYIDAKN